MSLFAPKTTTTAPGPTFSFGTPFASTTTTTAPNLFGTPAAPMFGAQPSLNIFGTPASTTSAPIFGAPQTTTIQPILGLGGASSDSTSGSHRVTKPRDAQVPDELKQLVELLRKQIKENKETSDQIAISDVSQILTLGADIKRISESVRGTRLELKEVEERVSGAKEASRMSVRQGDLVSRRRDSLPVSHFAGSPDLQPIGYLHGLTVKYDSQLAEFQTHLNRLEQVISARLNAPDLPHASNTPSLREIIEHLRKMEDVYRHISAKVDGLHAKAQDLKSDLIRYRKAIWGEAAGDPFGKATAEKPKEKNLAGPHPFPDAPTPMLAIATTLGKTNAPVQWPQTLSTSMFGQPQGSVFGPPANLTAPSLFRPLSATPLRSDTPAFKFGPAATTPSAAPVTPAFGRFSSPFSSSTSGTLFGGTAANIATVKPFGA